jgi:hypothetical protein
MTIRIINLLKDLREAKAETSMNTKQRISISPSEVKRNLTSIVGEHPNPTGKLKGAR